MSLQGCFLRELRINRRLTQKKLAARCRELAPQVLGIHQASITHWERGYRAPSAAQLDVLADALGLSVEERLHALRLSRELPETTAA